MKKLLFFLLLVCCSEIEQPAPIDCYVVTLTVSSTSGKVLNTESDYAFVYDSKALAKWKSDEGIKIIRDTVNHITTIKMATCIEPNSKGK